MKKTDALPNSAVGEVAPAPEAVLANQPVLDAIDLWFREVMHNSPVSRDTATFNHCLSAKEELKRRIASL